MVSWLLLLMHEIPLAFSLALESAGRSIPPKNCNDSNYDKELN